MKRIWCVIGCLLCALVVIGCSGAVEQRPDTAAAADSRPDQTASPVPSDLGDVPPTDSLTPPDVGVTPFDGSADQGAPLDLVLDTSTAPDGSDTSPAASPQALSPCQLGKCWSARSFSGACGVASFDENYGTGLYNVHQVSVFARAGVAVELLLARKAGAWQPAVIIHDSDGITLYDGEVGLVDATITVTAINSGRDGALAKVRVLAQSDTQLAVFLTGWQVVDGGFATALPTDATYTFTVDTDCVPPIGELLSPPNFDPSDVDGGYFSLPDADPSGLYTHKAGVCARGTQRLIDVIYTVAVHWKTLRPEYAPIKVLDLNYAAACSSSNHETHKDGTHVDIVVTCATEVACADIQPAIDLAKLFVDTGEVCGIIFNDTAVQNVVNPYFESLFSYNPWYGTFMRTVSGHEGHFHVRVKKPDGSCN